MLRPAAAPCGKGDRDGLSWATGFNDLPDALDVAQPRDEVWVAAGTYVAGAEPGHRGRGVENKVPVPVALELTEEKE